MTESTWTAKIIADDGCEQEATGETAVIAVHKLLIVLLTALTGDESIGEMISDIGDALKHMEDYPENESFHYNLGDFSLMSKLVVSQGQTEELPEPTCPTGWDRV